MLAHVVMAWSEARDQGLKRYFTGEPCLHGHLTERMIVSRGCVECLRVAIAACKSKRRRNAQAQRHLARVLRAAGRAIYRAERAERKAERERLKQERRDARELERIERPYVPPRWLMRMINDVLFELSQPETGEC